MNFVLFAIALLLFTFLFWYLLGLVVFLPAMVIVPLLAWAQKGERTLQKRLLFLPMLLLGFFLCILLPAAFYSSGIFAITSLAVEQATHTWIYVGIGGYFCFSLATPSRETNILVMLTSLACYILFMAMAGPIGWAIFHVGDIIMYWSIRIMFLLFFLSFLCWVVAYLKRKRLEEEIRDLEENE